MFKKIFLAFGILATTSSIERSSASIIYPKAQKTDIVDVYHGVSVGDPYRWLENPVSQETKNWVTAQQTIFHNFITNTPAREKIRARFTKLLNFKRYSIPYKAGDYYFYWKNDGLQNQSVFYRTKDLQATPEVVLDPNTLSLDGTLSIEDTFLTQDGKLLAYTISTHGSDWTETKILDISRGTHFPETINTTKSSGFTSISWAQDNSGFYYNRYLRNGNFEDGIYWHTVGNEPDKDQLIYKNYDPQENHHHGITEDGKYMLIYTYRGCSPNNNIAFRPVNSDQQFKYIFDKFESEYKFCGNKESVFYFLTDNKASHGKVIAVDVAKDITNQQCIIPESKDIISSAQIINNHLVCTFMVDAHNIIKIYDLAGNFISKIPLPTLGSAYCSGKQSNKELFLCFSSFLYPATIFKYDLKLNTIDQVWPTNVDFKPDAYVTKQVFYNSKDGTKVPMFIVHKKDLVLDGKNPTLLYAYGGFKISNTPFFATSSLVWLEQGGVFAISNIRGGGEYGTSWHEEAILENRQRAFDDFIAAGEWLIKNQYTNPAKLAINGGSNGGLLVGTCMQQRPELFGAVISEVPVTDMLRFHKFTAGRLWMTEYGDIENPKHFKAMYAYSPLHTVKKNVAYPPLLVMSAESDDRVVPMHSKKWVATLQEASNSESIILFRYENKAGHGAGKPITKLIDERTDKFNFLFKIFNMEFK